MKYEDFRNAVVDAMTERYPEASVTLQRTKQTNGKIKDALTILEEGQNVTPAIYLNDFYDNVFVKDFDLKKVCDMIAETYERNRCQSPLDTSFFTDYDRIKSRIMPELINYAANKDMLNDMPYRQFLDLAVILHVGYYVSGVHASIKINDEHVKLWGVTEDELFETAMKNASRECPPCIKGINQVFQDLCGVDICPPAEKDVPQFMVLSNEENHFGAATMAYDGMPEYVAGIFPDGYYMLPSSIHEVLILPSEDKGSQLEFFTEMVRSVNEAQVGDQEVLADHAYYYDTHENKFVY